MIKIKKLIFISIFLILSCKGTKDNVKGRYFLNGKICVTEMNTIDSTYYLYYLLNEYSVDSALVIDGYTHWQFLDKNIYNVYTNDSLIIVEKNNKKYDAYFTDKLSNRLNCFKAKNIKDLKEKLSKNGFNYPIKFLPIKEL